MNVKHHHIPLFILFVFGAWGIAHLIAFVIWVLDPLNLEFIGQYGDFFGCLNTLFSGLAMVGAVYAVLLQRQSLEDFKLENLNERRHQEELARVSKLEEICTQLSLWPIDILEAVLAARRSVKENQSYDTMHAWYLSRCRETIKTIIIIHFPQMLIEFNEIETHELAGAIKKVLDKERGADKNIEAMEQAAKDLFLKMSAFKGSLLAKFKELIDASNRATAPSLSNSL